MSASREWEASSCVICDHHLSCKDFILDGDARRNRNDYDDDDNVSRFLPTVPLRYKRTAPVRRYSTYQEHPRVGGRATAH